MPLPSARQGTHLRLLKAFDKKVFDLATQSMPADSGLRTINTQELLHADRKIWSEIAALHADGWSLGECLNEFAKTRSDLHALLQPCPTEARTAKQGQGRRQRKGEGPQKG